MEWFREVASAPAKNGRLHPVSISPLILPQASGTRDLLGTKPDGFRGANVQPGVPNHGARTRLVSVVLPTYNERGNIVPLIQAIRTALASHPAEIVVVDDNSPDGTAVAVREAFTDEPAVKVVVRPSDPGFAKSIRRGIEEAGGDVVVVMDTDFNHQPAYLPFMIDSLRYYDCVMGSRFLYGGCMLPRSRHLLSWMFNVFVRWATGGQITDNLYGLFAIRADVLKRCRFDEVFFGYGDYFIRLLYYLQRQEVSILQFPAVNGKRLSGSGNSRFFRTFAKYFAATWRLALRGGVGHHA